MKTKILEALKTKFVGVDVKILDKKATQLSKTVQKEEDIKTAVDGVTFQDILTLYGDSRADEAQKTAVKNYEKKHHLKDGKRVSDEDDDDDDPNEPAYFKKFRKETQATLDALKAENDALKKQKSVEERSSAIANKAKELGIPEYLMKRFSIADDADIDAELTSFKQDLVTNKLLPEGGGNEQTKPDSQYEAEADEWLKGFAQN